jgi:tetratricopeptide (TPR) repeat protein
MNRSLAILLVALATGCRSLQQHGPVPRSVANCRQLSQQGVNAMERGDWHRAEDLLAQAVRACPADSDARSRYAEALWHRGARREAIAQLEQAGHLATEDPEIAVRLGQFYVTAERWSDARKAADHALDLDPKSAAAWALRGRTLEANGALKEALADYQHALGLEPGSPEVLLQVAELYRRLNQPDRALVAIHSLIDSHPPGEEPQQLLYLQGLALTGLGRYGDAIESYHLTMQRGRPTAEIFYRLAEAELLAGHGSSAQVAADQALELEPNHPATRALLQRIEVARANSGIIQR